MTHDHAVLSPAEAAQLLGVSSKALRLYEQRGFVRPIRNAAGWRHYGPEQMKILKEVVALRTLGLSLMQIGSVLSGSSDSLETALAAHQRHLEGDLSGLLDAIERVKIWRTDLSEGRVPSLADLAAQKPWLLMSLPWPWAGETFELRRLAPVTYLVGPLGSGKTRLAKALAEALGGRFIGLDRVAPEQVSQAAMQELDWLGEDGADRSPALLALMDAIICEDDERPVVVDLVEDNLDEATQLALGAWLRRRGGEDVPLVVMTRSSAILDLEAVSPGHAILYCPANHSMPFEALAVPGTLGFDSVENCLGTPEARARTAGMTVKIG